VGKRPPPELLVTREAFWKQKLGEGAYWQTAEPPPPKKRNYCGQCFETIAEGERCLFVGKAPNWDGFFSWDSVIPGGPNSPLICERCSAGLVKPDGSRSAADTQRYNELRQLVRQVVQREDSVPTDEQQRHRQWPVVLAFLAFEFIVALIVKGSHAQGSGAIILYLIPVLGVFIYLVNHDRM
jgi:hypothetical protein